MNKPNATTDHNVMSLSAALKTLIPENGRLLHSSFFTNLFNQPENNRYALLTTHLLQQKLEIENEIGKIMSSQEIKQPLPC
jgi:hypothetical protein